MTRLQSRSYRKRNERWKYFRSIAYDNPFSCADIPKTDAATLSTPALSEAINVTTSAKSVASLANIYGFRDT